MADAQEVARALAVKLRYDFDTMLERVEAAQRDERSYDLLNVQVDVELAQRFVDVWWDRLSHHEQTVYAGRIEYMKQLGKGLR